MQKVCKELNELINVLVLGWYGIFGKSFLINLIDIKDRAIPLFALTFLMKIEEKHHD